MTLNSTQLAGIYRRLAAHHSRDPVLLRRIRAEMEPWVCECGRKNKKNARTCGSCKWGVAPPPPPWTWEQQDWSHYEGWAAPSRPSRGRHNQDQQYDTSRSSSRSSHSTYRQQSPRSAPTGRRKNRGRKAKNAAKPPASKAEDSQPSEPAWKPNLPKLTPVPAITAADAPASSSAEDQLKTLTGMLRKSPDQLTPETQAYLTSIDVKETQITAKSLHGVVRKLEKAQQALQEAQGARLQLHSQWRNFVAAAVQRWTQSTEDFKQDDIKLQEQITAAKQALDQIKEQYSQTNQQFGLKPQAAIEVSDEEDSSMNTASAKIIEGMGTMLGSLQQLQHTAEQMVEEQQKASKRQRVEGTGADGQPPFVLPDKK